MGHSNRGRLRSSAQKAGTSVYNNDHSYIPLEEIPIMQKFVDSSNNVIDTYYGGNPTASDVNLLLQTEDEIRAKQFSQLHDAFMNRLNPIPYAESQVDTNPFGPYNYPTDVNGYGYLGGYNTSNQYPIYDSQARRNPAYTIPENRIVETQAEGGVKPRSYPPAASNTHRAGAGYSDNGGVPEVMRSASTPFYSNDMHHRLVPQSTTKFNSSAKKALRSYCKQNGLY